ncbi:MAG: EF-P beta-lysylation protein EpmB [Thiomicrorhabdus chilensis]|uniref:EF-P beta-lysylation protein EpmB n=1 Tax=Thiomicrorhabdus chilensis TaxID=63656 RepID=UPI00299DE9DF|nr:EF-P beta-lysylation protein EpmB [Thiomicrorhabdus chilensis]MDX1346628.1 EF-P beta-lysylation protein EpmB [Thiomicrorhabdus chilensis]
MTQTPLSKLNQLCNALAIDPQDSGVCENEFPFKAPPDFINRIQPGQLDDPLLKQVLPVVEEAVIHSDFNRDPVGDLQANPSPSLIHKYHGRVLLMASPKCDIHCRYCFRRHFPYEQQINQRHWKKALQQISADNTIHEVILSGGDPFSLSETAVLGLIKEIERIEHIKTLRIHSRTPIVAPSKAPCGELLKWAQTSRLNKVLVLHCNHANELSQLTAELLQTYRQAGFHLLNQSVLLKGINDDSETLITLSHTLFAQGVLPYYLHQLDRVEGAAHFEVPNQEALALRQTLLEKLPGYLVPKLVKENAGEPHKTPL